jgi:DNA-binding transcriptional LysR family regulator
MIGSMSITLRQLEIFEKVAATRHVTKAGEQLLITQSAVSVAITELERMVGGPLFERRGRRLLLNDRGRYLLPEAREIIGKVRAIERALNDSREPLAGILHVGASTTIGNYLLPSILGEFSRLFSGAKTLLVVGNTQQIETAVENGQLDLGLIEGPCHLISLDASAWMQDELVVIVGKEHPWAQERFVSAEMLAHASWIIREKGSGTREVFESAISAEYIGISISLELGHTEAIKRAVEAGLGVGCLSKLAVQRELDNGWLIKVETPLDLRRSLTILTRTGGYRTKLLEACLALLREHSLNSRPTNGI